MLTIPNKNISIKRIFTYGLVGGLAFLVEYLSFILLLNIAPAPYTLMIAQSISFCLGLTVSFAGNRFFTFNDINQTYAHNVQRQAGLYLTLAFANLVLSNIIIYLLVHGFSVIPSISKLVVMVMVVLWNYIIFNKLIFKSKHS